MPELLTAPVGERTEQAISRVRDESGNPETGNVLRRVCQWAGEGACKTECQLRPDLEFAEDSVEAQSEVKQASSERGCADLNLLTVLDALGLEPEEVLMVGATADNIGFVDRLDDYDQLIQNPHGWLELPNFNGFFGREGEIGAIGCRMADCADINFEFEDSEGQTVFGFEHGTRTNMFGSDKYAFEKDGKKMNFTEYVLREAIDHYSADPATVHINLASAIKGENNEWHFDDPAKIEALLPGWHDDGFLKNVTRPDWQAGDELDSKDTWQADTRGMIIRDIEEAMDNLGIPAPNLDKSNILDPNESNGMHSSHKSSYLTGAPESRDLYITYIK